MKTNKINWILYFVFIILLSGFVSSAPVPYGIDGKVYELDGFTEISQSLKLEIKNLNTNEIIYGQTGKGTPGRYSAVLNWNKGVNIEVKVFNDYNYATRIVQLNGSMHYVDIMFNSSLPPSPPEFISEPSLNAREEEVYLYQAQAQDPNNDDLTYFIVTAPNGTTINNISGLLSWTPLVGQAGFHNIKISVTDGIYTVNQSFTLNVAVTNITNNNPPIITSSPPLNARLLYEYRYKIMAYDPENDTLKYILIMGPQNMNISNNTLTWIPKFSDIGVHEVKVMVKDIHNSSALQSFNISVRSTSPGGVPLEASLFKTPDLIDNSEEIYGNKEFIVSAEEIPVKKVEMSEASERTFYLLKDNNVNKKDLIDNRMVYDYVEISPDREVYFDSNIEFEMNKDWLYKRNIKPEQVKMLRLHDEKWSELETKFLGEIKGKYSFKSTTPGFSLFAISHDLEANPKLPEPEVYELGYSYTVFGETSVSMILGTKLSFVNVNKGISKETEVVNLPTGKGYQVVIDGDYGDLIKVYSGKLFLSSFTLEDDRVMNKNIGKNIFSGSELVIFIMTLVAITVLISYMIFKKNEK